MLGRYEILQTLGVGVFGEVLQIRDHLLDKTMACKLYDPAYKLRDGQPLHTQLFFLYSLQIEYQNLIACRFVPGIVRAYDFDHLDSKHLLFLEHIEGFTLETRLDQRVFTEDELKPILADLCYTVYLMHRYNVVHRDIHAGNLILTKSGDLKLIDFGYSIYLPFGEASENLPFEGRNDEAAPEFYQSDQHDYRVDYWGIGCLLYQLITGRKLIRAFLDDLEHVWGQLESEAIFNELPLSIKGIDFIRGLLAIDPDKRLVDEHVLYHPWIRSLTLYRDTSIQPAEIPNDLYDYIQYYS